MYRFILPLVVLVPLDSNVAVDTQVRFWYSMWISSVVGISKILCVWSCLRNSYRCENVRDLGLGTNFSWCAVKDRKMSGFYWQKPQMIIYAKLQSSRVRHQHGFFGVPLAKRHSGWERRRTAVFAGYWMRAFQVKCLSSQGSLKAFTAHSGRRQWFLFPPKRINSKSSFIFDW